MSARKARSRRTKPRALDFGPFHPANDARNIIAGLDGVQADLEKARDEIIEGAPLAGLRTLAHLRSALIVQIERAKSIAAAIARVES
ncbi:MAG TPA: hypothetical protein VMI54_04180 [Polyangiaceae bacterium]|nr:hypothetical protein [Polyangiaceae bacterium]